MDAVGVRGLTGRGAGEMSWKRKSQKGLLAEISSCPEVQGKGVVTRHLEALRNGPKAPDITGQQYDGKSVGLL